MGNLSRRAFIRTVAGSMGLIVSGCAKSVASGPRIPQRDWPNIIVVLADDQRADYLGCAGHPVIRTPHVDRLAADGVRFVNAFATSAACTPNRTCILTGQYERRHGVTFGSQSSLTLEAFAATYPMLLRQAGYHVGYVGKNHTPVGVSEKGFGYASEVMEKQFDYWYGNHGHSTFYPKKRHPIYRNARAETQVEILQEGAMNFLKHNPEFAGARDFLRTKPQNKPFCLLVNFNVPHGAGTGSMQLRPTDPKLYRTAYRNRIDQMPQPETYVAEANIRTPKIPPHVYNGKYISQYDYVKAPETLRERQVRTCQTIAGIDQLISALTEELADQGLAENTIFVYTSDHGLLHGEHGLGGKVLLYEESIRVPLIIYDPRLPDSQRGKIVQELALSIDIAPTILDLVGLPAPDCMQGRSLRPLLEGKDVAWRGDFFCENMFMGQNYPRIEGVRGREWKYLRYFDKKNDQHHLLSLTASIRGEEPVYEELYHLRDDPLETTNLAGSVEHLQRLERLRRRCRELVVAVKGGPDYPRTHVKNDPREKVR